MRTFNLGRKAWTPGEATDAHGNGVSSFAEEAPFPVYSVAPVTTAEPDAGRTLVTEKLSVLAPAGSTLDPRDVFVIDGTDYEVDGEIADWTKGPWGWAAGVQFHLRRARG